MKKREQRMERHPSCKNCAKTCNWKASTVVEGAIKTNELYRCNSSC